MIEIVLLSIVVLFIILISKMLIVEICIFYQRLKCKRNFFSSFFYLKRLGHVIVINGAIGAGKTTLMSLLSHLFNLNRRNEFRDKINNLKIKLNNVPFDKVDNIILDKINSGQTFDQIKKSVISILKNNYELDLFYYDYQNYYENRKLLDEYIECYLQLLRDNYVCSNIKIFDQTSGTYSYNLISEWLNIKDKKGFPFDNNTLVLEDEGAIKNSNSNSIKKLNQDDGKDLFLRLVRNASKGLMHYMTTIQVASRWEARLRELGTSFVYVEKSYLIGISKSYLKSLKRKKRFINKIYDLLSKLKRDPFYKDSDNYFRRKLKEIEQKIDKHVNTAFIQFDCAVYSNIDNLGKKITEELASEGNYYVSFVGPVNYCWGTVDSYCFKEVFNYLREISSIKADELGRTEIDMNYIDSLLKKEKEFSPGGSFIKDLFS